MQKNNIRIALFQPDIAQNTGAIMRLCACFGIELDIIEPCGFILDDEKMKRVAMDYIDIVKYKRHFSWSHFIEENKDSRLVLLTTKTENNYINFEFKPNDILVLGRESAGVPDEVHNYCHEKVKIMMQENTRSLNVAITTGIVVSEAIRQLSL